MTSAAAATRAEKPARKRAYNPGEPRGIRRTGETTYDVESFLRDGVIHEGVELDNGYSGFGYAIQNLLLQR